ncbi:MAG: class I SAM-dependent methyltransferase [Candidatus Helarchaeota archaeon]
MPKIEPFEKFTQKYEAWFELNEFAYQSELQSIKKQLTNKGTYIEIGVGTGRFSLPLGIQYGIDPSMKMLKIAKSKSIIVMKAIAEQLPFRDSRFDNVIMVTTICFLDNVNTSFKEVYRILKKGGFFTVGFVDKNSPLGRQYYQNRKSSTFYGTATFFSTDEVITYLKNVGFKNFQFTQTIFHDLKNIKELEPVREGRDQGAFIVIRATK